MRGVSGPKAEWPRRVNYGVGWGWLWSGGADGKKAGRERKPGVPAEGAETPGTAPAVAAPAGPAVTSTVPVHLGGLRVGPAPAGRRAQFDPVMRLRDTPPVSIGGDAGAYRAGAAGATAA